MSAAETRTQLSSFCRFQEHARCQSAKAKCGCKCHGKTQLQEVALSREEPRPNPMRRALAFGERLMEAHLSRLGVAHAHRPLRWPSAQEPMDWQVVVPRDDASYDLNADACWRCDAAEATTDGGLCAACHTVLKAREAL